MILEESLNGGYAGLYGEIVDEDVYHIREKANIVSINDPTFIHVEGHSRAFDFTPEIIFDLGANVGIFTRYARRLFPSAKIIAVEPDPDNFRYLNLASDGNTICINKAIGKGQLWKCNGAINGAHECYLSESTGYRSKDMAEARILQKSSIDSIMPDELLKMYGDANKKTIIKIDIEGNEQTIFEHPASMEALRTADYIVMELHNQALKGEDIESVKEICLQSTDSFSDTHHIKRRHIYFSAVKK